MILQLDQLSDLSIPLFLPRVESPLGKKEQNQASNGFTTIMEKYERLDPDIRGKISFGLRGDQGVRGGSLCSNLIRNYDIK